jgi:hypothetical protein
MSSVESACATRPASSTGTFTSRVALLGLQSQLAGDKIGQPNVIAFTFTEKAAKLEERILSILEAGWDWCCQCSERELRCVRDRSGGRYRPQTEPLHASLPSRHLRPPSSTVCAATVR